MFKITDSPDITKWSEFVYSHSHGNIFQTPEMAEVYKQTRDYEPITLAAVDDETDEILGILMGVLIKETGGFLRVFSARSIIQGGPLFLNSEMSELLLNEYDKIAKKNALFTQIRMMHDIPSLSDSLREANFKYEDHLNFITDLTKPVDDLWNQLFKSKRQAVNKANKSGVLIEEIKDREFISIFYNIVKKSYYNSKMPFADMSLFESAFDILVPNNLCRFFLAKYKDNYVAATCFLSYNGTIYDWYGGVDRAFSVYRPNELLEWFTIKWGAENGYRIFDFGGAGKPDEPYGPREFKKEFGGRAINYGRWTKVYSPIKMKIAETGFKVYRHLIGH
jgi:serine/alanine adding enzyme